MLGSRSTRSVNRSLPAAGPGVSEIVGATRWVSRPVAPSRNVIAAPLMRTSPAPASSCSSALVAPSEGAAPEQFLFNLFQLRVQVQGHRFQIIMEHPCDVF